MCFVWTLLMVWFRKRIKMAIAITKEAARAVNDMKVKKPSQCLFCQRKEGERGNRPYADNAVVSAWSVFTYFAGIEYS